MKLDILTHYFDKLYDATSEQEIKSAMHHIYEIWMDSGNEQANYLLERGSGLVTQQRYDEAIEDFTEVIEMIPEFAEGWNKRATAYYLRGDYKKAIDDVHKTLHLEPRHFGALSGLATIYLIIGEYQGALSTFKKLATIHPNRRSLQRKIDCLEQELVKLEQEEKQEI